MAPLQSDGPNSAVRIRNLFTGFHLSFVLRTLGQQGTINAAEFSCETAAVFVCNSL